MNNLKMLKARRRMPRKSRGGYSLVESILVMIAVTLLLVGLIALATTVRNMQKKNQLQSQLIRATQIIETTYSYSANYDSGSLLVHLAGEGFTDKELSKNSSGAYEMYSPYTTVITIAGDGGRNYTVVVNDLPDDACKKAALTFVDSSSGLDSLDIGGTTISLPISETAVAAACDNASNDVTLVF
jgi:type II secretory pathway pseudopilin PulG